MFPCLLLGGQGWYQLYGHSIDLAARCSWSRCQQSRVRRPAARTITSEYTTEPLAHLPRLDRKYIDKINLYRF